MFQRQQKCLQLVSPNLGNVQAGQTALQLRGPKINWTLDHLFKYHMLKYYYI